jgi:hypothetical protein
MRQWSVSAAGRSSVRPPSCAGAVLWHRYRNVELVVGIADEIERIVGLE